MSRTSSPRNIIYGLIDPRTLLVRYVGQSSWGLSRPKRHRLICNHGKSHCHNWIKGLLNAGLDYQIAILEEVGSVEELDNAERWWIAFGRACEGPLTNHTEGGGGMRGPSEETRAKMKAAQQARWTKPEAHEKISMLLKAYFSSPEARKRTAEATRKGMASPEVRAKIGTVSRGRIPSEAQRAKVSAALKGRPKTAQAREAMRRGAAKREERLQVARRADDVTARVRLSRDEMQCLRGFVETVNRDPSETGWWTRLINKLTARLVDTALKRVSLSRGELIHLKSFTDKVGGSDLMTGEKWNRLMDKLARTFTRINQNPRVQQRSSFGSATEGEAS